MTSLISFYSNFNRKLSILENILLLLICAASLLHLSIEGQQPNAFEGATHFLRKVDILYLSPSALIKVS